MPQDSTENLTPDTDEAVDKVENVAGEKRKKEKGERLKGLREVFSTLSERARGFGERIKERGQDVSQRFPESQEEMEETGEKVDKTLAADQAQKGRVLSVAGELGGKVKQGLNQAGERFKQTEEYEGVLAVKRGLEKAGHYAEVSREFIKNYWYSKDIRNQFLKGLPSIIATRLGVRAPIIAAEMALQAQKARGQRKEISQALEDLADVLNPRLKAQKKEYRAQIEKKLSPLKEKGATGETLSEEEKEHMSYLEELLGELGPESNPVLVSIRRLNHHLETLEQTQGLRTKRLEGKKLKYKVEEIEALQKELTEKEGLKPEERAQKEQEINALLAQENLKPTQGFTPEQALTLLKERLKQEPEARSQERSAETKQLRSDLAQILKTYRRQRGQIDSQEARDVGKIIKQGIQTKVHGMDVARESLNSALVAATGLATAGTGGAGALPAYATMRLARLGGYAFLGRVGRGQEEYQKLSKEDVLKRIIQKGAEAKRQAGAGAVALEEFSPEKRKMLEKIGLSFKAATVDSAREFFNAIRGQGRKEGSSKLQKGLDLSRAAAVLGRYGFMAYGIGLRGEKISDSVQFRQTFDKIIDQMAEKGFKGSTAAAGKSFVDNAADTLRLMSYSAKGLGKLFTGEAGAVSGGEPIPEEMAELEKLFSVSSEDGLSAEEFEKVANAYSNPDRVAKVGAAELLQLWKSQNKIPQDLWETMPQGLRAPLESAAVPPSSTELPQQTLELASSQKESPELLMEYDSQLSDATVHKGEGIEHALIRQLRAEPGEFGFKGDASDSAAVKEWAGAEAHRIALQQGYAGAQEGEVWVRQPDRVAYVLNKNGTVSEYDLTAQAVTETGGEGEELEPYEMRPTKVEPKVATQAEPVPKPESSAAPTAPSEARVSPTGPFEPRVASVTTEMEKVYEQIQKGEILDSRLARALTAGVQKFKDEGLADYVAKNYAHKDFINFITADAKDVVLTGYNGIPESNTFASDIQTCQELQKDLMQTWAREHGVNPQVFEPLNLQEQQSVVQALNRAKGLEDKGAVKDLLKSLNDKYQTKGAGALVPLVDEQVRQSFALEPITMEIEGGETRTVEGEMITTAPPSAAEAETPPPLTSLSEETPPPEVSAPTKIEGGEAELTEGQTITTPEEIKAPEVPASVSEEEALKTEIEKEDVLRKGLAEIRQAVAEKQKIMEGRAQPILEQPPREELTPIEGGEVRTVEEGIAETTPPEKGGAGTPESVTAPESTETPEKLEEVVKSAVTPIDIEEGTTRVEEGITTTEPQGSQVTPIEGGESEVLEVETATILKEEPAIIESRDYPSVAKQEVAPKPEGVIPESEEAVKPQTTKTETVIDQPDVKGKIETTKTVTEQGDTKETIEKETIKGDVFGTSKEHNELKRSLLEGFTKGTLKEKDFLKQVEEYVGGKMSETDIKRARQKYMTLMSNHETFHNPRLTSARLDAYLRTLDIKRAAALEIAEDAPTIPVPETVPNTADWVSELGGLNESDEKRFLTLLDTTLKQGDLKSLGLERSVLEELKDNDFDMLKARRVHLQALEKLRPALEQTVRSGQGGQETLKTLDKITNHLRKFVGSGNPIEHPGEVTR